MEPWRESLDSPPEDRPCVNAAADWRLYNGARRRP
jgi:hypothetical protein